MILKKLTIKNFFRYKDPEPITFSVNEKKNVVAIIGDNGLGKTTLLSAFSWCFYGKVESPLTTDKMYNKCARSLIEEGNKDSVVIEIDFEDKGQVYTIRREQMYKKIEGIMEKSGNEKISVHYTDPKGNYKSAVNPRGFFNNIIPENLQQFFFFDGEKINRLAQEDGRDEIRDAVLNILGMSVIENLHSDLNKVDIKLDRLYKKHVNKEEGALLEKRADSKNKIEELENKKKETNILIKEKKEAEQEISKFLETHNSTIISGYEKQRKDLIDDIENLQETIKNSNAMLQKHISSDAKHMMIVPILSGAEEILEEKRKKGELPSDIKDTFINDIIDRKKCICGTEFSENSKEHQLLKEVLRTAGRKELDGAYTKIISYIRSNHGNETSFFESYNNYFDTINSNESSIVEKKAIIDKIDKALEDSDLQEINEKIEYRKILIKQIENHKKELYEMSSDMEILKKEVEDLTDRIEKCEMNNNEAKKIQQQQKLVRSVMNLNDEVLSTFKESVRSELDLKIKEIFKSIAHKNYREPVLTEDLVLKVINTNSDIDEHEILSTGESQVSSLSFIGALVAYSREKQNSELLSSFMGGDFPIVMDSPFGNLDSKHSSHIAKGIGDLSNQVIIIVSEKQWGKEVEDNISHRLSEMWYLREGKNVGIRNGEYTFTEKVM